MSEQIAPCPYCGCQVSRLIAGDVHCGACGLILTSQMFAHLSRAAALLRAVEGLESGWLRRSTINSVEAAAAGGRVEVDAWEYLGARMGRGSGEGASFADALIALAQKLEARDA